MRITEVNIFVGCILFFLCALVFLWVLLARTVLVNKSRETRLPLLEKKVAIGLAESFNNPKKELKNGYSWASDYFKNNEGLWLFSSVLVKVLGLLNRAKPSAVNSFSGHIGLSAIIAKKICSTDWHTKAMAIRLSYELGLNQNLNKITALGEDKHILVQREAQIGLVTFLGWKSLDFFSTIKTPISQWQQICIIKKLHKDHPTIEKEFIEKAIEQNNPNSIELLIRIISSFKLSEYKYYIEQQLKSPDKKITNSVLKVLPMFESYSFDTWVRLCRMGNTIALNDKSPIFSQ